MKLLNKAVFIIFIAITLSVSLLLAKAIAFNFENLSKFTNVTLASVFLLLLCILGFIFLLSPLAYYLSKKRNN